VGLASLSGDPVSDKRPGGETEPDEARSGQRGRGFGGLLPVMCRTEGGGAKGRKLAKGGKKSKN